MMAGALDSYQARVRPGGSAMLPSMRDGAGEQIGRAIAGFGGGLEQIVDQRRATEQNEQAVAAALALEQVKQETEARQLELEVGGESTAPNWAGHRDAVSAYYDERAAKVLGGIADKDVRQRVQLQADNYRGNLVQRAGAFEASKRLAGMGEQLKTYKATAANRGRFATKTEDWVQGFEADDAFVDALQVAPDMREGFRRELREARGRGIVEGLLDRGQTAEARALIERGDSVGFPTLDPSFVDSALNSVGVIDRRKQAEAEAAARVAKAEAKAEVDGVVRQMRDDVPQTRETIARVAELVKKHGLEAEGYELGKLTTQADVLEETRPMLPAQIDAALTAVEAKIAKAGAKATPQDIWRRDALRAQLGNRRSQIERDPYQYAATNGIAVQPVDFADPGSVDARIRAQATIERATGRPVPFLKPDEASALSAQVGGGPQNRAAVAEQLARIPGPARLRAAEQIAPRDATLAQATTMTPQLRQELFEGEKLRQGNAQLVGGAIAGEIRARWGERAAPALRELPAAYQNGVLSAATNLYAYRAARKGADAFDEAMWDDAVNDAIDATGKGGIGQWNGRAFKLPQGVSQGDFERRWSRAPRISGTYWDDGSEISTADVKRRFAPVATPIAGKYWLVDKRGTYARNKAGGRAVIVLGAAR